MAIPGIPYVGADVGAAVVRVVALVLLVLVSAKCALCIKVASISYHYYDLIGRAITPFNMNYTNVLKVINVEYESLITHCKYTKPIVPLLSKNQTLFKLIESFKYCVFRTYGICHLPLLYVILDDDAVTNESDDPLVAGYSYGALGSVLNEFIIHLYHTDILYKSDNVRVNYLPEEATCGSICATSINPYSRGKYGLIFWASMASSHAGQYKWEESQKTKIKFLIKTKWNGCTFSFGHSIGLHRSSFIK